jgi:Flp pilus assembly protein CpaB
MKTIYLALLTMILLVFVSVGGFLVMQLLEQRNKQIAVLLAKHNYPEGTKITDPQSMFELREVREMDLPPGVILDFAEIRGRILIKEIREGEPVVVSHLKDPNKVSSNRLLGEPGPGKEMLMIAAKAREGSIRTGARVDVVCSKPNEAPRTLHNVRIGGYGTFSAASQQMKDECLKEGLVPMVVSIEVTPEDALALEGTDNINLVVHSYTTSIAVNPDALKDIVPGSHVSVFHVGQEDKRQIIVENVKVLAIDIEAVKPDQDPAERSGIVRMEVNLEQYDALLTAAKDKRPWTVCLAAKPTSKAGTHEKRNSGKNEPAKDK